jgi:hypothetical protein
MLMIKIAAVGFEITLMPESGRHCTQNPKPPPREKKKPGA